MRHRAALQPWPGARRALARAGGRGHRGRARPRRVVPGSGGRGSGQLAAVAARPPPAHPRRGRAAARGAHQEPGPGRRRRPAAAAARPGREERAGRSGRPAPTGSGERPHRPDGHPPLRGRARGPRRNRPGLAARPARAPATAPAGPKAGRARRAPDAAHDARWTLEPGRGIEPGSATAVNGPAARFTFAVSRWGKRELGTVTLTLHDRWRLAEGRVAFTLPSVDCYPSPAACSAPRSC